jgi:hypothetical protein
MELAPREKDNLSPSMTVLEPFQKTIVNQISDRSLRACGYFRLLWEYRNMARNR